MLSWRSAPPTLFIGRRATAADHPEPRETEGPSMTLEETWQQVDNLLRMKKRAQSEAAQLRECFASLLATPEGREFLKRSLPVSKHRKSKALLVALAEALDGPPPGWQALAPRERHDLLRSLLEVIPPGQTTHWNFLLRLRHEQYPWTGGLVIESLKAVGAKGDNLPQKLANQSGWGGLPQV